MFHKIENCKLTQSEIKEASEKLLNQMALKEKIWFLNGNWDPIRNALKYQNPYNPKPIETNGCKRLNISPI